MKVSVVIPAHNEEQYISTCLESLITQETKPDEIIVVDNNSTDKTAEVVKRFKEVTIVKESEQGMIPARNRGFNEAKYDIIARTDADTIVPSNWIARIKKDFEDNSIIALTGPVKFFYKVIPSVAIPLYFPHSPVKVVFGQEILFGPNMAIRSSAWEQVKDKICLEDRDVHEDQDLGLHVGKIGKILFDKKLMVVTSSRRMDNNMSSVLFEYPFRSFKTVLRHRLGVLL